VLVGAASELRKTQDANSLSLRERVRVRGNEVQPAKLAGRILQAQLGRLSEPVACSTPKQISRRARRTSGVNRQAHRCFERYFPPHPGPLPLSREGENRPPRFRQSRASRLVAARDAVSPLPEGEGQGEGEREAANQNCRTEFTSSTRPAPRANSLCYQKQTSRRVLSRTGVSRQARWCFERCFPLTPALPWGEGECLTDVGGFIVISSSISRIHR
jgi:hypothetical protein